jgi:CheY-like chemotaxis protein/HPt (histidine-containing phosphotransfer) domain-containing protein
MMLTFPHLKRKPELEELGVTASVVKPLGSLELENAILSALGMDKPQPEMALKAQHPVIRVPSRPLKILVAEDTPFNQKFILRLLERWNHRAILVENGRQALEAMKNDTYDIILMDVQMPQMDGLEAAAAIREMERARKSHIPIIAMTAHAIKGDRERCIEAGMDDYVSKPIDSDKLFEAIETLTRSSDTSGEPPAKSMHVDKEQLLQAFDGDWGFFSEVVDIFLSDYPRLLNDLNRAFRNGDPDTLMRAAHSLKGMLRNFQAEDAADVAFEIEKRGKAENFDGVEADIETLADRIAEVDKTLRDFVQQRPD